ncbi:WhiB family transcriptional regulator [Rhodococcus indonesiensis]
MRSHARQEDWSARADCRLIDPAVFFGPDDEQRGARQRRERTAKQICHGCPARIPCRAYALDSRQRYGIWGGTTEAERRARHPARPAAAPPEPR